MKVFIGTSRPIGKKCKAWAKKNMPEGFTLTEKMDEADIFISVMYDSLLTAEYLAGRVSSFNFHPSVLPDYRGSGGFSWAIINGEKETGITLHQIDKGIDTGDIIEVRTFPIDERDTAGSLFEKGMITIYEMFTYWFESLLTGNYETETQPVGGVTYYRKDLEKAKDLTLVVRALTFKGKEPAYYFNSKGEKILLEF